VESQGAVAFRVVARLAVARAEARLAGGAFAGHVDLQREAAEPQGLRHSIAGLKRPPGRLSAVQLCETNVRPRPNRRESFKCPGRHRIPGLWTRAAARRSRWTRRASRRSPRTSASGS